ncbi:hypothetical protein PYV00_14190 [Novosphingobium sp. H3SJ31-1]|uniref:Uncharacterized protein n=1 Tax=Novosphingobium album (ex Liu et al. 2023) TaxID=3031130 RepID=A0ABT5WS35_9SPHN|nr:hypothetical protein [Novosphingobium album (ex Liu et al. 2023)]MDE8652853.1 hypothetical protein [Novosphingobium album (ex Liu et al. 2023)]
MPSSIDRPPSTRPPLPQARAILHFYLHLAGFTATTLLLAWGLFALFFLALGGFSFDGLMHQLGNLTSRYIAASPERVASFKRIFVAAHLILVAGLIVLRRHRIVPSALSRRSEDHG